MIFYVQVGIIIAGYTILRIEFSDDFDHFEGMDFFKAHKNIAYPLLFIAMVLFWLPSAAGALIEFIKKKSSK